MMLVFKAIAKILSNRFVKTPILDAPIRLLLSGLPYAKMGDVVNAMVFVRQVLRQLKPVW